jgi:hypothetical protein
MRELEDAPFAECAIAVIDSLGAYITQLEGFADECEASIASELRSHAAECAKLLDKVKGWGLDPRLHGLLPDAE